MKTTALVLAVAAVVVSCSSGSSPTTGPPGPVCSCPADSTIACTGMLTAVELPPPDRVCGNGAHDDSQGDHFSVGTTVVRYTSSTGGDCSTRVTVTDREPPTLACAGLPPVVRTEAGQAVAPPLPKATDKCSDKVTVAASPQKLDGRGSATVTFTATDPHGNHATCTVSVLVENGFAVTDLRLAHAAIGAGTSAATSITLLWDLPPDTDADGYRIERAPSATGPWSTLGSVASTTTTYTDPSISGAAVFYRVVTIVHGASGAPVEGDLGAATSAVRALPIAASSYDLGVQPIPGFDMPANMSAGTPETMSAPVVGYVRYPTDLAGGPYPLMLMLHGNHGNCRPPDWDSTGTNPSLDDACYISNTNACPSGYTEAPNAQGLLSLAETLASHGYVVASVDANAVNCREDSTDGGYILQRSQLLIQHMRQWRTWTTLGGSPFGTQFTDHVDVTHAVLFGHSRGAEAVAEVPQTFATSGDVAGIGIAAVFALAPTNFDDAQPGPLPFATLVPVCDGDVFTYTGVQLYDRRLRLTGTRGPAVQFFMAHADHDHFNTEWVFDDNAIYVPSCTQGQVDTGDMQRRVLEVLVGSWADEIIADRTPVEPWLHAVGDVPPSVASYAAGTFPLDLRRSYGAPTTTLIDDFESGSLSQDLLGGSYATMGGFADGTPGVCTGVSSPPCNVVYTYSGENFGWPHYNPADAPPERSAAALDWNSGTGTLVASLAPGAGTFDTSGFAALSLRVSSRVAETNTAAIGAPVDFAIAIVDGAGRRGSALASSVATIPNLYVSSYPRAVLQTVRLSLAGLAATTAPAVDLHHLRSVELDTSAAPDPSGSLLVTDVEFAQ